MWKFRICNNKDEWIPFLCLFTLIPGFSWTYHEYLNQLLNVPRGDAPGGNDAPFYFMLQDVVRGLCAATGMLLSLVVVALTWKRFPKGSRNALWFAWLWSMPWVASAFVTYCGSSHLMDAQRAISRWRTHDEYLYDPLREGATYGALLFAGVLAFLARRRNGSRNSIEASPSSSTAPNPI
jgi:hypothetical protein